MDGTGFDEIYLVFIVLLWGFFSTSLLEEITVTGFYWVLLGFNEIYRDLPGSYGTKR